MKKLFLSAILIVALLASVGTVSANLIQNGGFEYPVVTPGEPLNMGNWQIYPDGTTGLAWNVQDGIGYYTPGVVTAVEFETQPTLGLTPFEGKQYAELDSYGNVNISQAFTTEIGANYRISYVQSCRYGDSALPSKLGVYLNNELLTQSSCSLPHQWTVYNKDIIGTGAVMTLKFADEGNSDSYGVLLDGVSVEKIDGPTPVPEFPTTFLPVTFIIGFLGAVLMIQRTRK
jgi:hypothetical protein